jgi:hypothetical protein
MMVKTDRYDPNLAKPKISHLMLYSLMKETHDLGLSLDKERVMDIYKKYVLPEKRFRDHHRLTEEQVHNNAFSWMQKAIVSLIKRGYLGLTFNKNPRCIEDKDV